MVATAVSTMDDPGRGAAPPHPSNDNEAIQNITSINKSLLQMKRVKYNESRDFSRGAMGAILPPKNDLHPLS